MILTLTGFMGCGKSSVGSLLSDMLDFCDFVDLDDFIEESEGRSVADIFREDGEAAFRKMETDALAFNLIFGSVLGDWDDDEDDDEYEGGEEEEEEEADATKGSVPQVSSIISLGGGTVTNPECAEMVRKESVCFYLRASVETLAANLKGDQRSRPLLQGDGDISERIAELLAERAGIYESVASHIIDTDGKTVTQIAEEIAGIVRA